MNSLSCIFLKDKSPLQDETENKICCVSQVFTFNIHKCRNINLADISVISVVVVTPWQKRWIEQFWWKETWPLSAINKIANMEVKSRTERIKKVKCLWRLGEMQWGTILIATMHQLSPKTLSGLHQKVSLELLHEKGQICQLSKKMSQQFGRTEDVCIRWTYFHPFRKCPKLQETFFSELQWCF